MATVLLLRHGRTTANADGTLAGRRAVHLDDVGRAQAESVGARLRAAAPAAVVSSPLRRCRQTLRLALPRVGVTVDDRLTECGYGDWEGQPLRRLATDPLWSRVQQHPSAVTFPAGEPLAAMSARAVAAIREWDDRITAQHGPDAVWVACSHGDVIKAIVADALGLHLDLYQRIVVDPASITAVRYTELRPFLLRLNDTGAAAPAAPGGGAVAGAAASDAAVGGGAGGWTYG
ncbi:phosphoglycerate mutase [Pilimelia anulata]|uniref:Phosphoglycerate mutase n=1 Tax=Pilimelia anulata TaxID=53371 RepID=A0A8J3B7X8_9ACTN|nr:MSMEG_4193 family putative phosphomutase [Pilimelia anulata]GGK02119.1 phosphoglycerate mutase [Pilimelia anulata]